MSQPADANVRSAGESVDLQGSYGHRSRRRNHDDDDGQKSAFVPLLIFFLGAVAWGAFQFQQLRLESETLEAMRSNQETQLQQAQRARQTLDSLALETQKLADVGNTNAKVVVEELRKRGITINRTASADAKK